MIGIMQCLHVAFIVFKTLFRFQIFLSAYTLNFILLSTIYPYMFSGAFAILGFSVTAQLRFRQQSNMLSNLGHRMKHT